MINSSGVPRPDCSASVAKAFLPNFLLVAKKYENSAECLMHIVEILLAIDYGHVPVAEHMRVSNKDC